MQRAWLGAFEAATLSGLATADPWDLAPAAEALAEMSGPPTRLHNEIATSGYEPRCPGWLQDAQDGGGLPLSVDECGRRPRSYA